MGEPIDDELIPVLPTLLPEEQEKALRANQLPGDEEMDTMELELMDDTEWQKVQAQLDEEA
jgi:hypothetical protein